MIPSLVSKYMERSKNKLSDKRQYSFKIFISFIYKNTHISIFYIIIITFIFFIESYRTNYHFLKFMALFWHFKDDFHKERSYWHKSNLQPNTGLQQASSCLRRSDDTDTRRETCRTSDEPLLLQSCFVKAGANTWGRTFRWWGGGLYWRGVGERLCWDWFNFFAGWFS